LLPRCEKLFAFDLHDQASRSTIRRLGLDGVQLLDPATNLISAFEPGSIDTIIALDVLEHVDDLREVCRNFAHLLSPQGEILISGPTETFFYRLGRRLAGFKTHFHERNICDVERYMKHFFDVRTIARLYLPIELFRISVARRPVESSHA
jgi:predicted SAM-dependent methyltransferase